MFGKGPRILMLCLGLIGCADHKSKKAEGTPSESALTPIVASREKVEIDATSRTDWVGFDLDAGQAIAASDLATNASWDLGFKRTSIKMNGATVKMQIVDQDYAALQLAPQDGYRSDEVPSDPAAPETTGLAFHQDPAWYVYDNSTHVISSRSLVYVIETNEGRHFKLKFTDYYNAERLPAYINFEYQELAGVQP